LEYSADSQFIQIPQGSASEPPSQSISDWIATLLDPRRHH
jgi:hypothetical protein